MSGTKTSNFSIQGSGHNRTPIRNLRTNDIWSSWHSQARCCRIEFSVISCFLAASQICRTYLTKIRVQGASSVQEVCTKLCEDFEITSGDIPLRCSSKELVEWQTHRFRTSNSGPVNLRTGLYGNHYSTLDCQQKRLAQGLDVLRWLLFFQPQPGPYDHIVDEREHTVDEWKSE